MKLGENAGKRNPLVWLKNNAKMYKKLNKKHQMESTNPIKKAPLRRKSYVLEREHTVISLANITITGRRKHD